MTVRAKFAQFIETELDNLTPEQRGAQLQVTDLQWTQRQGGLLIRVMLWQAARNMEHENQRVLALGQLLRTYDCIDEGSEGMRGTLAVGEYAPYASALRPRGWSEDDKKKVGAIIGDGGERERAHKLIRLSHRKYRRLAVNRMVSVGMHSKHITNRCWRCYFPTPIFYSHCNQRPGLSAPHFAAPCRACHQIVSSVCRRSQQNNPNHSHTDHSLATEM